MISLILQGLNVWGNHSVLDDSAAISLLAVDITLLYFVDKVFF